MQRYGSRCVKPPLIHYHVRRAVPMTVGWATYALSLIDKPTNRQTDKGYAHRPGHDFQLAFVRDGIARNKVAEQLLLAIREEVHDLA